MFAWLIANIATILICAALALAVALIVASGFRNMKKGKSSCGCSCASCPMSGSCSGGRPPPKKPESR